MFIITQPDYIKKAVAKYDKANVKGLYIKLNKNYDKDIIEKLDTVESKQGYVKQLIREDIKRGD